MALITRQDKDHLSTAGISNIQSGLGLQQLISMINPLVIPMPASLAFLLYVQNDGCMLMSHQTNHKIRLKYIKVRELVAMHSVL